MPTTVKTPTGPLWSDARGRGADVVLLSGLCDDGLRWGPFADRLAETFRVTVLDHRGTGRSAPPPRTWRVRDYVDDVVALLDQHGIERAHLVGSCLGAVVAQELAATHPERVRGLVLNGSWRGSDVHFQNLLAHWIWTAQHAQTLRELLQAVALSACTPAQWERGEVADELDGSVRAHGTDFSGFRRGFTAAARALRAYDAGDRLQRITAPALLTVGSLDGVRSPVHTFEVAAEIAGARVEVVRGAGRRPFEDEPVAYARLVTDFLSSVVASATPALELAA